MTPGQETIDKILDHNRLQLSALIDGELPPDEARFLLRRLQHDAELGGCWERWQLCGDVLRGRVGAPMHSGFAARVAIVVAREPGAPSRIATGGPRWLRWGGGVALAASVAVIALFMARQSPNGAGTPAAETSTRTAAVLPGARTAAPKPVALAPSPVVPDRAGQLATAVAVADMPRRLAARRSRGQSQRAAMRAGTAGTAAVVPVAVATNAGESPNAANPIDPFSAQRVTLPNRPWPRALLPGSSANGAFTVDYGSRVNNPSPAPSSSFYPFEPRIVPTPAQDAADRRDAPY